MAKIMLKPRLRCSWFRIGRRLIGSVGKRAVASAEAEAAEPLGLCTPKAYKQRVDDGHKIRPKPKLRCR